MCERLCESTEDVLSLLRDDDAASTPSPSPSPTPSFSFSQLRVMEDEFRLDHHRIVSLCAKQLVKTAQSPDGGFYGDGGWRWRWRFSWFSFF